MAVPEEERKGRGAGVQPENRFERLKYVQEHLEGIDETDPESNLTQFIEVHPKSFLNEITSPDVGMDLSANPYQGCEHGCAYCYARNTHNYWGLSAGLDFEKKILVKKNAPELLEKALRGRNWKPRVVSLSGNTDCYQPAERKFELTRKCLEVLANFRNPVGIITKNALIKRDLDVLEELNEYNLVHVSLSVTTLNEKIRRDMEPRTASISQRLKTIELLSSRNIPVHVMMAPIIPGINSHEILPLVQAIANAGAREVGYTIVRLNGQVADVFEDWIKRTWPDRAGKVLNQIAELHGGKLNDSRFKTRMKGEGPFAAMVKQSFQVARERYLKDRSIPEYNFEAFRIPGAASQLSIF